MDSLEPNIRFFDISRLSFGPEADQEMYMAADGQNKASADIDIHACLGGES